MASENWKFVQPVEFLFFGHLKLHSPR